MKDVRASKTARRIDLRAMLTQRETFLSRLVWHYALSSRPTTNQLLPKRGSKEDA
jgi:hypothetical protein